MEQTPNISNEEAVLWELLGEVRDDWNAYGMRIKIADKILEQQQPELEGYAAVLAAEREACRKHTEYLLARHALAELMDNFIK